MLSRTVRGQGRAGNARRCALIGAGGPGRDLPLAAKGLGWQYFLPKRWVVARFRLRFLLQELDLVGPEIILGRSPDCQITIEDPLVSRQHARITIANGVARVMDMGSRNGVRVNGNLI